MLADADFDDLGPGLHVLRDTSPLQRAGTLAARMRAELCATLTQADTAVAERAALPRLGADDLASLRQLAARVARAHRISQRTHARASQELAQRLAGPGAAVAVHPDTVRDRAAAVVAARAALDDAERELAGHEAVTAERAAAAEDVTAERAAAAGDVEQADQATDPLDAPGRPSAAASQLRTRRNRAIGIVMAGFGLGLILTGLDVVPLWIALVPALLACVWALRYLQPPHRPGARRAAGDDRGREEASSLLAEVSAATDAAFGVRRESRVADEQRTLLVLRRDGCQEELRVAERAWSDLAGDADVADVDEVVRRFDPQHEHAVELASHTTTVRAVGSFLDQARDRWVAAWDALGLPAPEPADAEDAVERLGARLTRPLVLVGPATVRGSDLAEVAPSAPVIVLDGEEQPGSGPRSADEPERSS